MPIHAIAPSPVARLLLELEARGATGGLDVGLRRLVLTQGAIVEVRPASDDAPLGDFLVAAGRLSEDDLAQAKKQAGEQRSALEVVLRSRDLVPLDVLLETRRALWLDRFVRGLAAEEKIGKQPGLLTPEPNPSTGPSISTLPFVLDALARRAGFGDAEQVGREASAWFHWLDTPQRERAATWADFGVVEESLQASMLFVRHPAAPSRIAALVRAGLARLSEERSPLPQPAPRIPVIAAPAPRPAVSVRPGSIKPPPLESVRPLSPGVPIEQQGPLGIEPVPPWFPEATASLDDPLDGLERRIASLEQSDASASERARAWLDLARAFRTHHDSIDEAARASREAASADPKSPEALEAAASMCSAIGRPDLAYAYAVAWADALSDGLQRARVLVKASEYATRAEKDASALRALRLASDALPDEPLISERLARALATRGDATSAVRFARLAAERYRKVRPEAARAVLSWAAHIAPDDPEVASDFASALAADGFGEAAVAVIARTARRTTDANTRTKLWLHAAVRAELAARPDLASDLLLEALDREPPEATRLHEPLANDLAAASAAIELAWMCTELSEHYRGAEKSRWLLRAGEARAELPGEATIAVELLTQALMADPSNMRAYELIAQLAESEHEARFVSDAIERTLSTERLNKPAALALLDHFLERLVTKQRAPLLERWAWAASARLGGRGPTPAEQKAMENRLAQFETEIRALEHELRTVPAEGRAEAAVKLAERMRDDPARRPKAKKLLDKVLEIDPTDAQARKLLTALLRLLGDTRGVAVLENQRVALAASGFDRVSAELAWIHAEIAAHNPRGAIDACLTLLSHAPKNREALFLLWRLARKTRDEALTREALLRRVDASLDPRERARSLMAVSRAFLSAGDPIEAVRRADAALAGDPRCADAALLLVEYHGELEPVHRVAVLRAARTVLGDAPDLLAKLARACFGTRDPKGQLEALEAHVRLAPFESFASLGLAALWATGQDGDSLTVAVKRVLSPERLHPAAVPAARNGIERLWSLGHRSTAIELVIEAVNTCGEVADDLLAWAIPLATEVDDSRLTLSVFERAVARSSGDKRKEALRRLAHFHRDQGARHAEARAYLRLLAAEPSDPEALERLAFIYAETREVERLTSVLTLRLELSASDEERGDRMLSLALAAAHLANDHEGARELVASALARELEDGSREPSLDLFRRGVGLLLSSSAPQSAFDLLLELSESAPPERRIQLLEEAVSIAERFLDNPDLALRAATLGLESAPHHTPFLLHFERLALDLGDVATGREVYRYLIDSAMGVHGQRAVLYRAARWLERAGSLGDALSVAEQAFALAPSQGAILHAIERLSRATGQFSGVVRALRLLGDDSERPPLKAAFYLRAAVLAEDELRDPERAFGLYELAFATLPDPETEAKALACARRWALSDPDAARRAETRWREALIELVKDAWATPTRVRGLISLARLALDVFNEKAEAERYVRDARDNLEADEDLASDERAILSAELATVSARVLPPEPPPPVREEKPVQPPTHGRAAQGHLAAPAALGAAAVAREAVAQPVAVPHGVPREALPPAAVAQVAPVPQAQVQAMQPAPVQALNPPPAQAAPSTRSVKTEEITLTKADPQAAANDVQGLPSRTVSAIPYSSPRHVVGNKSADPFGPVRNTASMLGAVVPRARTTDPGIAPGARTTDPGIAPSTMSAKAPDLRSTQRGLSGVDAQPVREPETVSSDTLVARDESERRVLALAHGDRDALAPLLSALDGDVVRTDGLCTLLLRAVRQRGPSVPAIEGLLELATRSERRGLTDVCIEALALFDGSQVVPRITPPLDAEDPLAKSALLEARDDGDLAPMFTMLAHVYQGASPLFRRSLTSYGVSASDFVSTNEDGAYGQAMREVAMLLGVEHEAYLKHSNEDRVAVVPTQPPAIVIGSHTHEEPRSLLFRVARAFERARPGSVLLATQSRESAETLLAALKAAFGPTDGKSPPVARDAAAMAAELWRTMPSASQRQVGNLFRVLREPPPLAALMQRLSLRAARVALVAGGGLDVARAAMALDPLPADQGNTRAFTRLDTALAEDPVLSGLVVFALSDAYLALREPPDLA
jgi:Tfp pilus assembly protein PilF